MIETKNIEWRVEVVPVTYFPHLNNADSDYLYHRCKDIVKDIERHVDGPLSCYIESTTVYICTHCGWSFEEPPQFEDLRCISAQDEYIKNMVIDMFRYEVRNPADKRAC